MTRASTANQKHIAELTTQDRAPAAGAALSGRTQYRSTRSIDQNEQGGRRHQDRPGEVSRPPGYRKTPDWKVVPGQAYAIPASPSLWAGVRKKEAGAPIGRQMVLKSPRDPGATPAPGSLDA